MWMWTCPVERSSLGSDRSRTGNFRLAREVGEGEAAGWSADGEDK